MNEPVTAQEWQEAADAAVFSLALHAAWCYGLVSPDPKVDVDRCEEVLELAPAHGAVIRGVKQLLEKNG